MTDERKERVSNEVLDKAIRHAQYLCTFDELALDLRDERIFYAVCHTERRGLRKRVRELEQMREADCPTCDGDGWIHVRLPTASDDGRGECPTCKGSKKVQDGLTIDLRRARDYWRGKCKMWRDKHNALREACLHEHGDRSSTNHDNECPICIALEENTLAESGGGESVNGSLARCADALEPGLGTDICQESDRNRPAAPSESEGG